MSGSGHLQTFLPRREAQRVSTGAGNAQHYLLAASAAQFFQCINAKVSTFDRVFHLNFTIP